jgi:hypothetical protein
MLWDLLGESEGLAGENRQSQGAGSQKSVAIESSAHAKPNFSFDLTDNHFLIFAQPDQHPVMPFIGCILKSSLPNLSYFKVHFMAYWLIFWAYLDNKNHFYKYGEQFVHGVF